jgi:hypothetical protein
MIACDVGIPARVPNPENAQREAEFTQVNGKLYAIAKVQSDKSCPLTAGAWPSSVVR